MSRATALDALAYIVHDIRPDWDRAGILAVLHRQPDRIQARAVLTEALQPPPDPPVPDGQHPLI